MAVIVSQLIVEKGSHNQFSLSNVTFIHEIPTYVNDRNMFRQDKKTLIYKIAMKGQNDFIYN